MRHVSELRLYGLAIGTAENGELSVRRLNEPGEHAQQRRLARAVFTKDQVQASGCELARDHAQRREAPVKLRDFVERNGWIVRG